MLMLLLIGAGLVFGHIRERSAAPAGEEGINFGPTDPGADAAGLVPVAPRDTAPVPVPSRLDIAEGRLKSASISLCLGILGGVFFNPLLWLVTGDVLNKARFLFVEAWHALRKEGRLRAVSVDSVFMAASLLGGHFLLNVALYWFYCLFNLIALKTEDHSRRYLVDVFTQQARRIWVHVDGVEVEVPFETLKTGDIIIASAGDLIPVDGEVVHGAAGVDQHLFTGEAQLVEKMVGDSVYASTIIISGRIRVRSQRTGADTLASQIAAVLNENNSYVSTVESRGLQLADQAALPTLALSAVALLTLGTTAAITMLICDFGSGMRVFGPVAVLKHLEAASRRGLYVKDGRSLELLRDVDMLIFDKTGTLTEARLDFVAAVAWKGHAADQILAWAAAAEQRLTHPIARSIVEAARQRSLHIPEVDDNHYEVGFGVRVRLDAGLVRVGSLRFMHLEAIAVPAESQTFEAVRHDIGHSVVFVAVDDDLVGAIEVEPRLRPHAREIVHALRAYCPAMCIISGDRDVPTRQLAEKLGIEQYFAEVLPHQKADIVERLQREGRRICFVGDGINDSVALQKATVSVSFQDASSIATDCAQVVMLDSDLDSLITLFQLSRSLDRRMRSGYRIGFTGAALGAGGVMFFGLGLTGGALLANTGRLTGLAYAMITPDPDPTNRPSTDTECDSTDLANDSRAIDPSRTLNPVT